MGSRSSLAITSIVLSIMALIWIISVCITSIMYSYYRYVHDEEQHGDDLCVTMPYSSDPDEHIKIEKVCV